MLFKVWAGRQCAVVLQGGNGGYFATPCTVIKSSPLGSIHKCHVQTASGMVHEVNEHSLYQDIGSAAQAAAERAMSVNAAL